MGCEDKVELDKIATAVKVAFGYDKFEITYYIDAKTDKIVY